jgi:hypothetical protein
MINYNVNYKFAFIGIFIAYNIAQSFIVMLKPELSKYVIVTQFLFFVIPIIIIHIASIGNNKFTSIKSFYKLNFKFNLMILPCIL